MCNPVAVAIGMTAVTTAMSAKQAHDQQSAQNKQAKYASAQADANAVTAEANARKAFEASAETRKEGVEAQRAQVRKAKAYQEQQKQALAKNGVFVGDLSAVELLEETEALATQDRDAIRRNYNKRAFGMEQQGYDSLSQAKNYRSQSGGYLASVQGSGMAVSASILDGVSSGYGTYSQYKADGGQGFKAWRAGKKSSGANPIANFPVSSANLYEDQLQK